MFRSRGIGIASSNRRHPPLPLPLHMLYRCHLVQSGSSRSVVGNVAPFTQQFSKSQRAHTHCLHHNFGSTGPKCRLYLGGKAGYIFRRPFATTCQGHTQRKGHLEPVTFHSRFPGFEGQIQVTDALVVLTVWLASSFVIWA